MKQEMNKCFNIYASKIMECEKLEDTVKQLYYCYFKYNGYEYAKDYKEIVNELTSENKESLAAKIESCGNLEEVEKKELLSYIREHDKVKVETINRFAKQMVKFWNEQAHNAYDFPSLDIWFKDGSYLKFFIDLRKVKLLICEVPAFAIAYADEKGSMEFPFAAPSVLKESLSKAIKIKKGEKPIVVLTKDEINRLEDLHQILTNKTLISVLDVFLFSCYSGLSYIDMKELQPEDIRYAENGAMFIEKKRHKTGTTYTSVLFPQAEIILQRYNYHLPVITNQKTNEYLKQLGAMAQIDKNVHLHLGRSTYATQLLNMGVRMETVSKALGHKKIDITQKHYARLISSSVIQEIEEVIAI